MTLVSVANIFKADIIVLGFPRMWYPTVLLVLLSTFWRAYAGSLDKQSLMPPLWTLQMSKLALAFWSVLLSQVCVGFPKVLVLLGGNLWSRQWRRWVPGSEEWPQNVFWARGKHFCFVSDIVSRKCNPFSLQTLTGFPSNPLRNDSLYTRAPCALIGAHAVSLRDSSAYPETDDEKPFAWLGFITRWLEFCSWDRPLAVLNIYPPFLPQ